MTGPGRGGRLTEYTVSIRRSQGAIWDRRGKIAALRSCRAAFPVRGDSNAWADAGFRWESPRHEAQRCADCRCRAERGRRR
jgi:hypothetical protein